MKKQLLNLILTLLTISLSNRVHSQAPDRVLANAQAGSENLSNAQNWSQRSTNQIHFTENEGQIIQTDGQPAPYVNYMLQGGNTNIYILREGGIAYQFNKMHYPEGYEALMAGKNGRHTDMEKLQVMEKEIMLETYRMDMNLVGANSNAEIITEGKSSDYTNYYTHDALFVHHYKKVIFKNIYPGIDWVIYSTAEGGIEYDFVLQAGADPSLIKMEFTNHEELLTDKEGNLLHGNCMGRFTEKGPVSFQDGRSIATKFVLTGKILTYALESYNHNMPITIDPALIWGTYYGDSLADYGNSCATDDSGNVYLAGRTSSTTNIASGGHQNTFGGATYDAFLVKFNTNGVRQWGTYYGGNQGESGTSCATDINGNVYLTGYTNSTTNIAYGGHQNTYGSNEDAFLVKFNSSGVRQWGTYYGGNSQDNGYSCATDISGNVYLAGRATSTTSIASGGYQNTYGGGGFDAFLVKFNSSGVRQWGTYYGGNVDDEGRSCATDGSGNVYLAGFTDSPTNIASGGHQNTYGGNVDAFMVKFNDSGTRLWGTYYGGNLDDFSFSCVTDSSENVYLAGETKSAYNIASGGFQDTLGGGSIDAFLAKFNGSGSLQWGTYYGGSGYDLALSCATDGSENVYLAGATWSNNNIAFSGYQNTFGGGTADAFLVKFDGNGVRQWGTYYGDNGWDEGWYCSTDASGNVYLAGHTASTSNIASGGHQSIFGGGSYDAFLVKFDGTSAAFSISNSNICTGSCISLSDSSLNNPVSWQWDITGPQVFSFSTQNVPSLCLTAPGYYSVQLTTCNAFGCDTATLLNAIKVDTIPIISLGNDTIICLGDSLILNAGNGYTSYQWSNGSTASSIIVTNAGSYNVLVQNGECNATDSIVVLSQSCALPVVAFSVSNSNICEGSCISLSDSSLNNPVSWQWDITGPQVFSFSTQNVPSLCLTAPGYYSVQLTTCNAFGCDTATLLNAIKVDTIPIISLGNDTIICLGDSLILNAGNGYTSYQWSNGSTASSIIVTNAGSYAVLVQNGTCNNTDSIMVLTQSCTLPVAAFTISDTTFCEKQCLSFYDNSQAALTYQWYFPGASPDTSTLANPTNICYNFYGTYDVILVVCNPFGCDSLFLPQVVKVYQNPVDSIYLVNDTLYSYYQFNSYQWYQFPGGLISGATNSYFVTQQAGNYFCVVFDSLGCEASSNVVSVTTGIAGTDEQTIGFRINPNPNDGTFEIILPHDIKTGNFECRIFDAIGKNVFEETLTSHIVNLNLGKGIYQVVLKINNQILSTKLILQKN